MGARPEQDFRQWRKRTWPPFCRAAKTLPCRYRKFRPQDIKYEGIVASLAAMPSRESNKLYDTEPSSALAAQ
jgi:hypothetical protein